MSALDRFAPGHLGELTTQVPVEVVNAVLAEASRVQRRVRLLPARVVVVYLLLAGALFSDMGWSQVWARLTAGLPVSGPGPLPTPSRSSIWAALRRVGPRPMRPLFDLLKGPAATVGHSAAERACRFAGLLVVAIDGTTINVPDCEANLRTFRKLTRERQRLGRVSLDPAGRLGGVRYPDADRCRLRPDQHQ